MKKGIDVSAYQKRPDWKQVKEAGISFAILRVANRSGVDSSFEYNYKASREQAFPVGVYRFSYALNETAAAIEANEVVRILAGRKLELGVWLDLEWESQRTLPKQTVTNIAKTFLNIVEKAGYSCGIYCSLDWYRNVLDINGLPYPYWIARYPHNNPVALTEVPADSKKPTITQPLFGWQYSSKGVIPGIEGSVDLNVGYMDAMLATQPVMNGEMPESKAMYQVKVLAEALNIRSGASADNTKIGVLPKDILVQIVEERAGFGRLANLQGWIHLSYVKRL